MSPPPVLTVATAPIAPTVPCPPHPAKSAAAEAGTSTDTATTRSAGAAVAPIALTMVGILLVALNLRAAITSLGALLDEVTAGMQMSATVAGVITTLPTLSFAAFGALTPWLARRIPAARLLVIAMLALAGGLALRAGTGSIPIFVLTSMLALAGIAVANILLPVLVREHFPHRSGLITGVYIMTMTTGTSAATAATVPIAHAAGSWRAGLGIWALFAALAAIPWLIAARKLRTNTSLANTAGGMPASLGSAVPTGLGTAAPAGLGSAVASGAVPAGPPVTQTAGPARSSAGRVKPLRLRRNRLAWAMAVYFGMQSLSGYATMGWLAQMFRDADFPPATAGLLLAGVTAVGVPVALLMPTLAGRRADLRPLVLLLSASMITAYIGLAVAPHSAALLWITLLAIGQGAFPMALVMIGMRSRTAQGTVALSAFAQSNGYVLAALGPLLVGVFYELTGAWTLPLGFLVVAALVQVGAGLIAARPAYIEDGSTGRVPARV